ncbi:chromosome 17 open reading frame 103 [Elysia marginata]|uniref:Protein NATD1 n=1 Tax=Elysia marginata TaxID=1093978 RepID=A0AAV4GF98_9GAST|nr:chromosome 17 open reading frame 103 [Elysia marginata]
MNAIAPPKAYTGLLFRCVCIKSRPNFCSYRSPILSPVILRASALSFPVTEKFNPQSFARYICTLRVTSFSKQVKLENSLTRLIGTKNTELSGIMSVPRKDAEKSSFVVGHDSDRKMFYVELQDKSNNQESSMAKLEYEWVRPGLVDLYHTETPPAFQGQGIAKVLVLAGLDHFCEQDVLIRPTCTYVQKVLRDNLTSVYKDHVEESYLSSLVR